MTKLEDTEGAKIIHLDAKKKTEKSDKASERKWGAPVLKVGFCLVPSLLLRAQKRLGLNATQLTVLLQLIDFWWDSDRKPYPSKKLLAERLSLGERQIQRYMEQLEGAGLLKRVERYAHHKGRLTNEYDLSGLVKKLKELEPEFREANEMAKEIKRQVTRRGGLKAKPAAG